MQWKELARRLSYLARRSRFNNELDDEIQFHIETRADELEQSGVPRTVGLAQARRELGHAPFIREETRAAWRFHWFEDLAADLQYAARALSRNPGFAFAAIVSLALGIGVNTAIFSLTNEFLLSSPSCRHPETLAAIRLGGSSHLSMPVFRFVSEAKIFPGLAGVREEDQANWRNGEDTQRVWVVRVTGNFFEVTGVPVAMGRTIRTSDADVTVISDRFWRNRLGADPGILGRSVILDGRAHTVIGVLPRDHRTLTGFGLAPDLYMPATEATPVAVYARLQEGMTRPEIFARLAAVGRELDRVHPRPGVSWSDALRVSGVAGTDSLRKGGQIGPLVAFFAMLAAVTALVLLIACANVASLLLARASSRRQELALRLAIGASRSRVIRQLLAESLLLAVLGALAGLSLNLGVTTLFNRIELPIPIPVRLMIQPDGRLLLYSAALAVLSALFAGLGPALKATRVDLNPSLKLADRHAGAGRWNIRNALVVGQVAVSIILLGVGFLFVRNLLRSTTMDPGFDVDHTLWANVRLVPERYAAPEKVRALVDSQLEILRAAPGVESASIAYAVPLNDAVNNRVGFRIDNSADLQQMRHNYNRVGPGYFRTMSIPILSGAEFRASDTEGVVIINESFAKRAFGNQNPVGHTIRFEGRGTVTVVGLAKDSKYSTLGEENTPALYDPYFPSDGANINLHFLIRAAQAPADLVKPLTRALGEIDPSAAIEVKPMSQALGLALLPSRVGAALLGSIGLLGLTLASIGLYGVLFYAVSRRIREIGLRVALGARPADILRMVFGQSFLLVGLGFAIGLGLALLVTRPLTMFLVPGLSPADPISYLAVTAVLAVVAAIATIAPALHALRVDAMTALRYE